MGKCTFWEDKCEVLDWDQMARVTGWRTYSQVRNVITEMSWWSEE
jgi:hypothetical protein